MINKKSQITLFIIIGLIILIGAGIYTFIRVTSQPSEKEISVQVAEIPVEFRPINDYVVGCIAKVGKEGIKLLGFHGGYIDLNKYGIQANSANPTQSRAFLFNSQDPNSGIAYWNYFKSDNRCEQNCQCASEQPFLTKEEGSPNIEKQLEDYTEEHLDNCLAEFRPFKSLGYEIKTMGDIKATVSVRDNDVLFNVKYTIEAKKGDSNYKIENFITTLPVELKKIYELADQIKQNELNFTYLERWTVEQLAGFGLGNKENRLPPIASTELDPGKKPTYWIKQKVEDDITNNMLPLYTPFLSVFGTANYNTDFLGTFYERATMPIASPSGLSYTDLDVKFNYLNWWPIYFDITGRGVTGQRIGPETMSSSFFSFIGLKRYNFYYDVSYPTLIDIYSSDAFNYEGFHFYFGLETNVRNNEPINCSGPGITQYSTPSGSLFCNYNQGCANITIEAKDARTNQPLDNVAVYYSSGAESCDKGFTGIKDNRALLETSLPTCVGSACSLNAVKDGYWYYPKTYAVRCDNTNTCSNDNVLCSGESLLLNMEPLRNNSIIVMKKKMLKQAEKTWVFNDAAEKLLNNEYAVVTLQKIKDDPNEEDFTLMGVFYGNQTSINLLPGFVPGNYELKINLFYQFPDSKARNFVSFKEVEDCEDMLLGLIENCVTIGPYNFTEAIVEGGFTSNISLTRDMLDTNKNIILYTLSVPDIDTSYNILDVYDIEEMSKLENYSKAYKVELKPTTG